MIQYSLQTSNKNQQYIQFKVTITETPENCIIYLPKWRPGRYELGNFAKNVRNFHVFDSKGKRCAIQKIDTSSWQVTNSSNETLTIEYGYYAAELNAGSTYLSIDQLYVNPVNCFIYLKEFMELPCSVTLDIPTTWNIAGSLQREKNTLLAPDFHTLADSPFICSEHLQYNQYEVNGTIFHLWFNTTATIPWTKVIHDFKAFTQKQIDKFIEFPVPHYHFLIHLLPYKAYHGVEHQASTVITLGPTFSAFTEQYQELLGVSSHELYHTWNVKAIRPIEMYPYDYQQENFSKLGYLCEGVTTYMGDLMLYKSGVFSLKDYIREMNTQLQKHFDNFGRFNYSVADASWDTWLDGYQLGAPRRKVSIYTEGCLLAFVTDVLIRQKSGDKHGIDEVMKRLYFNFALNNKGVSESDYQALVCELGGPEMQDLFNDYFYGTRPFEAILTDAFEIIGFELDHKPIKKYSEGRLGFKAVFEGHYAVIKAIYPGSPADVGGLQLEDKLIALNRTELVNELDNWLQLMDDDNKTFLVSRKGQILELTLPEVQRHFYNEYTIKQVKEPNAAQKKAFENWGK